MVAPHSCNQPTFAAEGKSKTSPTQRGKPQPKTHHGDTEARSNTEEKAGRECLFPILALMAILAFLAISWLFNLPTYQITHLPNSA